MKLKSSIRQQQVFTDLRELEKHISKLQIKKENNDSLFYVHRIPELPAWTNKINYSQGCEQNIYKLKCSCDEQKKLSKKYFDRDIRLACKHIYWKLTTTKVKTELDSLTKLLLDAFQKSNEMKLFKISFKDEILILGFTNPAEWINVFTGKEKWNKYSFNVTEKGWAYNKFPKDAKLLSAKILSICKYLLS